MEKRVAYGRVSTASGEQLSALDAQLAWLENQGADLILSDVESGRVVHRTNYQQLKAMVEAGEVSEVIATALSRLGRDATESDTFIKLCDQHGVAVITRDDGRLTMATPEDLLLTRLKGSLAQGESMKISQRVCSGYEQGRKLGKPMRKPCWGYKLSEDKMRLVPHPTEFDAAKRFIAYLKANDWRTVTTLRTYPGKVPFASCRGVRCWLLNPTLRGGIAYGQIANHRFDNVLWDRHEALLSHADFAAYQQRAESNRKLWGVNAGRQHRLLTSLCVCSECGCKLKYIAGRTIPSLKCSGTTCSQLYKGTREQTLVEYAIQELCAKAGERLARAVQQDEPPEAIELRASIKKLRALNDPDLAGVISQKEDRLAMVVRQPPQDDALLQKVADPKWYDLASYDELRSVLQQLVAEIVVTKQVPTAIRLRL